MQGTVDYGHPMGELSWMNPDHPMVEIMEPDKPGQAWDCPSCGFVVVVPHPGFVAGHEFCLHHDGHYVRLVYLGEYLPPTKVWEGDYA